MSTLHIYHNMHLKSKINTFNKNDVIILHNRITINLLKHLFRINHTDMNELNLTFITIEELLQGKIDNMRFDYIVGNPPYQYPKNVEQSKKLYIDITHKVLDLLKESGTINFITPSAIMIDGSKNKVFKKLLNNVSEIDYTVDKHFNIGQSVCSWIYSKNKSNSIVVRYENKTVLKTSLYEVCSENNETTLSICNKLNYKRNSKQKAPINRSFNETYIDDFQKNKDEKYNIPIYTNSSASRIQYANSQNNFDTRLLIPYIGGWKEGCLLSNIQVNSNSMVNTSKKNLSLKELQILKKLLESKLYSYAIVNYTSADGIKPQAFYSFLLTVSIPDNAFSREWTDDELYKEFNLTDDEINEVENWYKEWII